MWSHISVSKSPSSPTWTRPQASSSSPPAGSWNHIPLLPVISWWITVNSLALSPTLHLSFHSLCSRMVVFCFYNEFIVFVFIARHTLISFSQFFFLFTFLSPVCSGVNPKAKNEGNTISPSVFPPQYCSKDICSFDTKSSPTKPSTQLYLLQFYTKNKSLVKLSWAGGEHTIKQLQLVNVLGWGRVLKVLNSR